MIMVLGALMVCLVPAAANDQSKEEWQSTSVLMPSGSNYSSQISEVGAVEVVSEAKTTTEVYSPAKAPGGPRRVGEWGEGLPEYGQGPTPIGDAVWPLLLMAIGFGATVAIRKRRKEA